MSIQYDSKVQLSLATVASVSSDGLYLRFEGESEPTGKPYPVVRGVSATAGDRVVCARMGGGWLVLGAFS